MTQHTPGPWEWQEWEDGTIAIEASNLEPDIIARQVGITPDNARLIAAAPELLEALQAVWRDIPDLMLVPGGSSELSYMVSAAIAKATKR